MPLYDYGCPACGSKKEVKHFISEIGKIEVRCESCGQRMKKLLSAPSLIGFDNVGRSISKKDIADNSKRETKSSPSSTGNESASKKDAA